MAGNLDVFSEDWYSRFTAPLPPFQLVDAMIIDITSMLNGVM